MGRALNEHAPALPGGGVDLIDLERGLELGFRDTGSQVLSVALSTAVRNTIAPSCSL
jgi:hypothetical protein